MASSGALPVPNLKSLLTKSDPSSGSDSGTGGVRESKQILDGHLSRAIHKTRPDGLRSVGGWYLRILRMTEFDRARRVSARS